MKMKISKKRLQEIIQEEYALHEEEKRKALTEAQEEVVEEVDEAMLARALAEVLAEEGLGDGEKLGGNYSTGSGKGSESPYQTAVGGKDK